MTRSQSRELAFILLFEKTFTEEPMQELIARAAQELAEDAFAFSLALGASQQMEGIDALLSECSKNWKISRVSRVALSAMRIAVYEMLFEKDIPESVSINEAIELTKKYASPEDASYVNGVLGAISRRGGTGKDKGKKAGSPGSEAAKPELDEKPQPSKAAPDDVDGEGGLQPSMTGSGTDI